MSQDNAGIGWLHARLKGKGPPVIIDGGMGTELQRAGVPMDDKVWCGRTVLSHPEDVLDVHEAYIKAGAEVITTNTFSAGRHMLEPHGAGDHVARINSDAVRLAKLARKHVATRPVAIAGSICEWTTARDSAWSKPNAIVGAVREQANLLADAGADLLVLEMCQYKELSVPSAEAALETGLPLWIGVSAHHHYEEERLSTFDDAHRDFEELIDALARLPAQVMNVMHTPLNDVHAALDIIDDHWSRPVGVYPESGYFEMPKWKFVKITQPKVLAQSAQRWVERGVRMLGGCCGLGPEHIAELRKTFPFNE